MTAPPPIGIVACSAEGRALLRTLCTGPGCWGRSPKSRCGHSFAQYDERIVRATGRVAELMLDSARKLPPVAAASDLSDNTIRRRFLIWASVAAALASHRRGGGGGTARGFRKLGLTGTRWLV